VRGSEVLPASAVECPGSESVSALERVECRQFSASTIPSSEEYKGQGAVYAVTPANHDPLEAT